MTEADDVREHYAGEPGKGHLAEELLNQRANHRAHGSDDSVIEGIDVRLGELGWTPAETREAAAADRKAAAKVKADARAEAAEAGDKGGAGKAAADEKAAAPQGRQGPPRSRT
jgi:hypothetical protein